MKVYISGYRSHWLSPYTILEKVFFWREIHYDEPLIDKLSDILKPFCLAYQKVMNFIYPRIEYVKIDNYDTWSMDSTLSPIILPMLKQLKKTQHGAPYVDDADVPDWLKSDFLPHTKKDEHDLDPNHFRRWEWIMDEMIFAFEHIVDDSWEDEYRSGHIDFKMVPVKDQPNYSEMEYGPNHTYQCDWEGIKKVNERIQRGLNFFGKYYRSLWD